MSEKLKGRIIAVTRWTGQQHGHGKLACFDPDERDEVTVWLDGEPLALPDGSFNERALVDCYRHDVEEPAEHGPTLYANGERLAHFVER